MCMLPPSGGMGSPWKDAHTGPQPTAGSLPPPLPRSEMQSVLVQQLSLGEPPAVQPDLGQQILYVCHKDGFWFLFFTFMPVFLH